jgi:hypothetical protein
MGMATTADFPDIHTQAGAKFLAPFLTAVLLALLAVFAMIVYPHVTG